MTFLFLFAAMVFSLFILFAMVFQFVTARSRQKASVLSTHQDSDTLSDISQSVLGFPTGLTVRSRFSRLRYLSRAEVFMEDYLRTREESWSGLVTRLEQRFDRVDERLFQLRQLLKRLPKSEDKDQQLERLNQSHQQKIVSLTKRVEDLLQIQDRNLFLAQFMELNELVLTYQDQVKTQILEATRILAPDMWMEGRMSPELAVFQQIR